MCAVTESEPSPGRIAAAIDRWASPSAEFSERRSAREDLRLLLSLSAPGWYRRGEWIVAVFRGDLLPVHCPDPRHTPDDIKPLIDLREVEAR